MLRKIFGSLSPGAGSGSTLVALGTLVIAGCDWHGARYPTEATVHAMVVHGVLVSGVEAQEILVERTRSVGEGFFRGLTPLEGAKVEVTTGDETHVFREDAGNPGVFRARFVPRVGERYRLHVTAPDGQRAEGHAVIPGTPRLLVPMADTAARPGDDFSLHWTRVPAAGYVVVRGTLTAGAATPFREFVYAHVIQDTTARTGLALLENQPRRFGIAAVDSGFARYLRTERGGPLHAELGGAYGLFGAVAFSNERRVMVAR